MALDGGFSGKCEDSSYVAFTAKVFKHRNGKGAQVPFQRQSHTCPAQDFAIAFIEALEYDHSDLGGRNSALL